MAQSMLKGIHHITATVNEAQEDYDFYTRLLGLRLVKKTVNFDNNKVYHFYYGNKTGSPGTIMTTFPYARQGIRQGSIGNGQVYTTQFSIAQDAMEFWQDRLLLEGIEYSVCSKFGMPVIHIKDPSGLVLELVGNEEDQRMAWASKGIPQALGIKGFFGATLYVEDGARTIDFLHRNLGFQVTVKNENTTRLSLQGGGAGKNLDIQEGKSKGKNGIGTVHHIAWIIEDETQQLALRKYLVEELDLKVTEVKDRKYFRSIYFRIPGGVLFEVATAKPGFAIDEPVNSLGSGLMLPEWEEKNRQEIELELPKITD